MCAGLADAHAAAGHEDRARRMLADLVAQAEERQVLPVFVAVIYGRLGLLDEAFAWLERAYEARSDWLVNVKVAPWFDPIRGDPRYPRLLERMGLA
jgi:hypothetical protein